MSSNKNNETMSDKRSDVKNTNWSFMFHPETALLKILRLMSLLIFSKSHKLSSHAGFEPCLCFGDALVWWEWDGQGITRSASRTSRDPVLPKPPKPSRATHDFVRTHFHRSTQCDFCNKKVRFQHLFVILTVINFIIIECVVSHPL